MAVLSHDFRGYRKLKYNKVTMPAKPRTKLFIEGLPLTTPRISGIGYTLVSLINELSCDPAVLDQYDIVLFVPRKAGAKLKQHGFQNVTIAEMPWRQRFITWSNFLGLLPKIDHWLGCGVYLFGNYTNYPLSKKSRSVTFVYDICFKRYPELVNPKARGVLERFVPKWISRTDLIVTTSQFSKVEIAEFFPSAARKTQVMPGGVDTRFYTKKSPSEIKKLKAKYGLPDDYVLFLSNIEPRKNVARLVQAYARLPEPLRNDHPLVLVGGDSWLSEPIHEEIDKAKAAGCKIIQPRKYIKDADLPALHSGASALALPSIYEGFGLSPLQAMACSVPCLVSETTSLPEVVGDAALLVDPLSIEDITQKLEQILTSQKLRENLIKRGHQRAETLSWANSKARLLRIIA